MKEVRREVKSWVVVRIEDVYGEEIASVVVYASGVRARQELAWEVIGQLGEKFEVRDYKSGKEV